MYQHDISESKLSRTLEAIVTECVSFVGLDLNLAPAYLLRHISGINVRQAENICQWRLQNGAFLSRNDLRRVKGIGDKAFQQCAGFVRITNKAKQGGEQAYNPLDATLIHPESYSLAQRLLTSLGFSSDDIGKQKLIRHLRDLDSSKERDLLSTFDGSM